MGTALKIGVAVVVVLLAIAYFFWRSSFDTSGPSARQLVSQGARLVDVRSREEFSEGHIEGATNIPVQEIGQRLRELEPKDQPVVLYCRSGYRSAQAASTLKDASFTAVHNLGAMSRW